MFEARLSQASIFKKLLDSIRELVTDANFACTSSGITLQAMDSSHVSLVGMLLRAESFEHYRCDRSMTLGINLAAMAKILKCAGNDDTMTLKAEDDKDTITFMFESENGGKVADFELKLMDIEQDALGIPDIVYKAVVSLPSDEFQRIVRDLTNLGETVTISATKEGVKFSVQDDIGGNILLRRGEGGVDKDKEDTLSVKIDEPVSLKFALRYLQMFTKATGLSKQVSLSMSAEVPLVCQYQLEDNGYVCFYLAPKIDDEEDE